MSAVKILIVEDELLIAEDIRMQLENLGYAVNGMAVSYNEAVDNIMQDLPDLVLVDINIEGSKDGIELGHFLREEAEIPFIYLTSNSDKATIMRAKETHPDAYLVKPFKPEGLFTSIEMALASAGTQTQTDEDTESHDDYFLKDCLFVKKDNVFIKVKIENIKYIKSEGNYVIIFISAHEKHMIRNSIKNMLNYLPDTHFFQTHKSYIVNLSFLKQFSYTSVTIDDKEIPLAKSKREQFFNKMHKV